MRERRANQNCAPKLPGAWLRRPPQRELPVALIRPFAAAFSLREKVRAPPIGVPSWSAGALAIATFDN
jgi:hypothetical protein